MNSGGGGGVNRCTRQWYKERKERNFEETELLSV